MRNAYVDHQAGLPKTYNRVGNTGKHIAQPNNHVQIVISYCVKGTVHNTEQKEIQSKIHANNSIFVFIKHRKYWTKKWKEFM